MKYWAEKAKEAIARDGQVILATLGAAKGSTPRGAGAKMLISREGTQGTIGGGNLEFMVTEQARKMLAAADVACLYQHYALGPLLSQCCGGAADVLLEKLTAEHFVLLDEIILAEKEKKPYGLVSATGGPAVRKRFVSREAQGALDGEIYEWRRNDALPLYMFGAGHVGKAMAEVLGRLNFDVKWIDGRQYQFPEVMADNVERILSDDPLSHVRAAPPDSIFLIFTYSHQLDYEITGAVLKRGDFRYCGMIGSATKRVRFEKAFLRGGGTTRQLRRFTSPMGLTDIRGKEPEVIAISVAAELLMLSDGADRRP